MSTTFDTAVKTVHTLPTEDQERIGRELTVYLDHLNSLRTDLHDGIRSLDAGFGTTLDIESLIREARATHVPS